jgi:transposase InsO family protein
VVEAAGVKAIRLPPRSPNLNAFAERFVLSIKSECLDRIVPMGEGHLRTAVAQFVDHYHRERNHQGVGNQILLPGPTAANSNGRIRRRERLGGLLSFYYREAA